MAKLGRRRAGPPARGTADPVRLAAHALDGDRAGGGEPAGELGRDIAARRRAGNATAGRAAARPGGARASLPVIFLRDFPDPAPWNRSRYGQTSATVPKASPRGRRPVALRVRAR